MIKPKSQNTVTKCLSWSISYLSLTLKVLDVFHFFTASIFYKVQKLFNILITDTEIYSYYWKWVCLICRNYWKESFNLSLDLNPISFYQNVREMCKALKMVKIQLKVMVAFTPSANTGTAPLEYMYFIL